MASIETVYILDIPGMLSPIHPPTNKKAPAIARAIGVRDRGGSPLLEAQLPGGRTQALDRLAVGLFIDLLSLELGLQLLHPASPLRLLPTCGCVAANSSRTF